MLGTHNINWTALMPEVARRLLGDPTSIGNGGHTCRYRRKGSLAVHVGGDRAGTFKDFESGDRGGVLELIERERTCDRAEAKNWLRREGLIPARSDRRREGAPPSQAAQEPAQSPAERRFGGGGLDLCPRRGRSSGDCSRSPDIGKGVPADDTPGHLYLALRRWVWPGSDVAGASGLPQAVGWLSRQAALARGPETGKRLLGRLPEDSAGALLFALTDPAGNVVAVQFRGPDRNREPHSKTVSGSPRTQERGFPAIASSRTLSTPAGPGRGAPYGRIGGNLV